MTEGLLSQLGDAGKGAVGRMTVRNDISGFPEAVFDDDEEEPAEGMVKELEEDIPMAKATVKKTANAFSDFDFPTTNAAVELVEEPSEEDNPFHYAQKKGLERRRSYFAGTGFEKLASTEQEESDLEDFFTADKVFLILTHAGKPVYSS